MAGYLPLTLNTGEVMLYKIRQHSLVNNYPAPANCNWGSIYQISPFGIYNAIVGQSVLYRGEDVICTLALGNTPFPIVEEAKLVTTEIVSLA